jgi:endonuclease YncB( thermonuclease family)
MALVLGWGLRALAYDDSAEEGALAVVEEAIQSFVQPGGEQPGGQAGAAALPLGQIATPASVPEIPEAYCVPGDTPRQVGTVVAVTDGETLHVEIEGQVVTVRYIGVDAPDVQTRGGAAAFDANRALEGQQVLLVQDVSEMDSAGNLPRYVFAGEVFVNYQMVEGGLAEAVEIPPDTACSGFFLAAEENAQAQQAGIWAPVDLRMEPAEWRTWPVIPLVSENARHIYARGVELGRDPHHFSILGDCQAPQWKLFGRLDWRTYELPEEFAYLQPAVDHFEGQWGRNPITVVSGNTVATLFSVYWADPDQCGSDETPVDCEIRVNNPSIALLMLGTNWEAEPEEFDTRLRHVVGYLIERGILPVLVTKADSYADSTEEFPLNEIMAQVAYDYDIPLWNFWLAVQHMPYGGLDPDDPWGFHLLPQAFPVKRMTGVQAIDAVLMGVLGE